MNFSARLNALLRAIRWHRRTLGMLAAALCLLSILSIVKSSSSGTAVLVAGHDLAAGSTLSQSDLATVRIPSGVVTQAAITDPSTAVGHVVVAPRPRGAVLTESDFLGNNLVSSANGSDLVSFRVADKSTASVLSVGDMISVVGAAAGGDALTIAQHVRVAALPAADSSGSALNAASTSGGALIIVSADRKTARDLAAASAQYTLSVVLEGK